MCRFTLRRAAVLASRRSGRARRHGRDYFDIDSVSYTLITWGERTQLTLSSRYRVSTRCNWYAEPVARLVLGNTEEVLLGLYRRRSEAEVDG